MKCDNDNCDRAVPFEGHRWCEDCWAVVLRTGRPPELPAKFEPEWLRRSRKKPLGLARILSDVA